MVLTLHRAVQYIAAAGIGHATQEADDGHTTCTWEAETGCMVGVPLGKANGIRFALSIPQYAMQCLSPEGMVADSLPLLGAEHEEITAWFQRMIKSNTPLAPDYRYRFHYDLPCHTDRSSFPVPDATELQHHVELRTFAHEALQRVLVPHEDTEAIRIWPHHFDSGSLITLARLPNGTPLSTIGLGLAIPDDMIGSHYLYVSPWHADGTADTTDLPELSEGRWSTKEWKGAVLDAEDLDQDRAVRFFKEASEALLEPVKH